MEILGIDIGGTGIKGAPVDIEKGILTAERYRVPTPQPSMPDAVADVVAQIVKHFDWKGPIGCTFPAVVKNGIVYSAANVDDAWIGTDCNRLLEARTGCPVLLLNDADAAGLAEMNFGAGKGRDGLVFIITLGTGIGSALFVNGLLVPNTELGHIYISCRKHGLMEGEDYASALVRKEQKLKWKKWAGRVEEYLGLLETIFSPDLFIVGGGVSKKHSKFLPRIKTQAEIVPAQLRNEAGIVGAALAASEIFDASTRRK